MGDWGMTGETWGIDNPEIIGMKHGQLTMDNFKVGSPEIIGMKHRKRKAQSGKLKVGSGYGMMGMKLGRSMVHSGWVIGE
jgi:hypothetical protein